MEPPRMARHTKQGIDYFPTDVEWDHKIQMYILDRGPIGLAVLVTIWQLIYSEEGYWIKCNDDLPLLVRKRIIDVDINEINVCINSCLSRQIFDESLHRKFGILTSKAVQKRYFEVCTRRKCVHYVQDFVLIPVNDYNNLVHVDINAVLAGKNTTKESKVKGKVKKSKEYSLGQNGTDAQMPKNAHTQKEDLFEEFWKSYPRRKNKGRARKAWDQIKPKPDQAQLETMLAKITELKTTHDWAKEDGRFIPHPSSWLNAEGWEDEQTQTQTPQDRTDGFLARMAKRREDAAKLEAKTKKPIEINPTEGKLL